MSDNWLPVRITFIIEVVEYFEGATLEEAVANANKELAVANQDKALRLITKRVEGCKATITYKIDTQI